MLIQVAVPAPLQARKKERAAAGPNPQGTDNWGIETSASTAERIGGDEPCCSTEDVSEPEAGYTYRALYLSYVRGTPGIMIQYIPVHAT